MKSLIIANWKMNPVTFKEAKKLFEETKKALDKTKQVSVVIAPPAIFIRELKTSYKGKRIQFAVQNAYFEAKGSHTGEISFGQSVDAGATYAIIGHAERRAMGETNEDVNKKVVASLTLKLLPILCIGEHTRDGNGGHYDFIREQLQIAFREVPTSKLSKIIIAYEPVWAIGGTTAMNPRDMHEMAIFIRKTIVDLYGQSGMSIKILYGGSVDETNAPEMLREGDVDGLLVGRVSTDAVQFAQLISSVETV